MRRRTLVAGLMGGSCLAAGIYWPNRWNRIVIHHTAGNYATVEMLREVRRQRQPNSLIDEIPYHYVIGNGNGIAMGEVVETQRVAYDLWGAHVSRRRTNLFGLGVCLVGNFEVARVPEKQLEAAVTLTARLVNRYRIPLSRVTPHGKTEGEASRCPGRHFPFDRFAKAVAAAV